MAELVAEGKVLHLGLSEVAPDTIRRAVLDHHAAGFIYRSTDDTPADEALARWATEIVPAVREAITR